MKMLEVLKDIYFSEHDRKDHLHQSIAHPLLIGSFLYGALFFYLGSLPAFNPTFFSIWFYVHLAVGSAGLFVATFCLIKSFYNYTYYYIPTPNEIYEYEKALKTFHADHPAGGTEQLVEADLREFLLNEYLRGGQKNSENNDRRSGFLHKTNSFIIFTAVMYAICFAPYFVLGNNDQKTEKGVNTMAQEQPPKEKPTPPRGREIKEGSIPGKNQPPPPKKP